MNLVSGILSWFYCKLPTSLARSHYSTTCSFSEHLLLAISGHAFLYLQSVYTYQLMAASRLRLSCVRVRSTSTSLADRQKAKQSRMCYLVSCQLEVLNQVCRQVDLRPAGWTSPRSRPLLALLLRLQAALLFPLRDPPNLRRLLPTAQL